MKAITTLLLAILVSSTQIVHGFTITSRPVALTTHNKVHPQSSTVCLFNSQNDLSDRDLLKEMGSSPPPATTTKNEASSDSNWVDPTVGKQAGFTWQTAGLLLFLATLIADDFLHFIPGRD